jgi:hypothetical protein
LFFVFGSSAVCRRSRSMLLPINAQRAGWRPGAHPLLDPEPLLIHLHFRTRWWWPPEAHLEMHETCEERRHQHAVLSQKSPPWYKSITYNICLNPDSCSTKRNLLIQTFSTCTKRNLLIQTFSTWTIDLFGKQDYVDAMCKDCTYVYSLSLSLFCPWNKTEKPSKLCWSSFALSHILDTL